MNDKQGETIETIGEYLLTSTGKPRFHVFQDQFGIHVISVYTEMGLHTVSYRMRNDTITWANAYGNLKANRSLGFQPYGGGIEHPNRKDLSND